MKGSDKEPRSSRRTKGRKYEPDMLFRALCIFVDARKKCLDEGFTDNGGAIHSVERILDILSMRLRYEHLSHINDLKKDPTAEMSVAAQQALEAGQQVMIEHVQPQRAYAQKVCDLITQGKQYDEIKAYIDQTYRLVLLTKEETSRLNKHNRSAMTHDRIAEAGITLYQRKSG